MNISSYKSSLLYVSPSVSLQTIQYDSSSSSSEDDDEEIASADENKAGSKYAMSSRARVSTSSSNKKAASQGDTEPRASGELTNNNHAAMYRRPLGLNNRNQVSSLISAAKRIKKQALAMSNAKTPTPQAPSRKKQYDSENEEDVSSFKETPEPNKEVFTFADDNKENTSPASTWVALANKGVQTQTTDLEAALVEKEEQLRNTCVELKEEQAHVDHLEAELAHSKKTEKAQTDEREQLQARVGHLEAELAHSKAQTDEREQLQARVGHLEAELAHSKAQTDEREQLQVRVDELMAELAHSKAQTDEREQLQARVDHLEAELAHSKETEKAQTDEREQLQVRVDHLEAELVHSKETEKAQANEREQLQARVDELMAAMAAHARAVDQETEQARADERQKYESHVHELEVALTEVKEMEMETCASPAPSEGCGSNASPAPSTTRGCDDSLEKLAAAEGEVLAANQRACLAEQHVSQAKREAKAAWTALENMRLELARSEGELAAARASAASELAAYTTKLDEFKNPANRPASKLLLAAMRTTVVATVAYCALTVWYHHETSLLACLPST